MRRTAAIVLTAMLLTACAVEDNPNVTPSAGTSTPPTDVPEEIEAEVFATVDFSDQYQTESPFGLLDAPAPDTNLDVVELLRPVVVRGIPRTANPDVARTVNASYTLRLSDLWGYPPTWNGNGNGLAPWENWAAWEAFVQSVSTSMKGFADSENVNVSFEVWDQPDNPEKWTGTQQQWLETWLRAEKVIRTTLGDRPTVLVYGPGTTKWNPQYARSLQNQCEQQAPCRVDGFSWYEQGGPADANRHQNMAANLLGDVPFHLVGWEPSNKATSMAPGDMLAWLESLEGTYGTAAFMCNTCEPGTINGLVTDGSLNGLGQVVSIYQTGNENRVTGTAGKGIAVVATRSSSRTNGPMVILGRPSSEGPAVISALNWTNLQNVPGFPGKQEATVTVEKVAADGTVKIVSEGKIPIVNDTATVLLPSFAPGEVFIASLAP